MTRSTKNGTTSDVKDSPAATSHCISRNYKRRGLWKASGRRLMQVSEVRTTRHSPQLDRMLPRSAGGKGYVNSSPQAMPHLALSTARISWSDVYYKDSRRLGYGAIYSSMWSLTFRRNITCTSILNKTATSSYENSVKTYKTTGRPRRNPKTSSPHI